MSKERDKRTKEDDIMTANALQPRRLDFSKISNRIVGNVSTEEALKDVTPIQWSEDVLNGNKKVTITKEGSRQ